MTFSPQTLTVPASGLPQNLTLTLSAAAPAGGLTVNLSSSNQSAATVPASVNIAAGATSALVAVTPGSTQGSATITATVPGVTAFLPNATASVTVNPPNTITLPANVSIGTSQSTPLNVTLSTPAPSNVTITLTSTDTSKVTISPGTVTINAGQTAPATQPTITGVNLGAATINATGPGLVAGSSAIHVTDTVTFTPTTLTITGFGTQNITLNLSSAAPASGLTVNLSSSDTSKVTVPATASFAGNATSVQIPVTGIAFGTATIHASLIPDIADATATVTVQSGGIQLPQSTSLQPGQTAPYNVTLTSPAPAGGVTVSLSSSNTSAVTISPATVTIAAGQTTPATQPNVTGVAYGTATISASAPGFTTATGPVAVTTTITFSPNPLNVPTGTSQSFTLTLGSAAPAGGLTVNLNSSDPSIATVPTTATFAAGATTASVAVNGVAPGSAVIHASAAPNIGDFTGAMNVSTTPTIILPQANNVGIGASAAYNVTLSSPALSNVTINLQSSDTSKVTISPASVTIAQGATAPATQPQVTGVNFGSATITATGTGLNQGTGMVQVTASLTFNPNAITIKGNVPTTVQLNLSGPAPAGGLSVTLASGDTSKATVPASATIAAGATSTNVVVTPVAVGGPVTITASTAIPQVANGTLSVTVQLGGAIQVPSNLNVTLGTAQTLNVTLSAPAPAGGLTVNLASSDTSRATVSAATVTIAAGQTAPATQPTVTGVNVGPATITATSALWTSGSTSVVVGATVTFNPANGVSVPQAQSVNASVVLSGNAPAQGIVINLSASDPTVAGVPASVTIPGGSNSVTFTVQGLQVGSTTIHASGTNIPDATMGVTVTVPLGNPIIVPNAVIGKDLQTLVTINLPSPAPVGGAQLTITSNDTSKLLISGATGIQGGGTLNVTVPQGQTSPGNIVLQALVGSGTATYTAHVNGFTDGVGTVTFTPSSFILVGPNGAGATPTLTANSGSNTTLNVAAARLDAQLNFAQLQMWRAQKFVGEDQIEHPLTMTLNVSSDTPSAGTVSPASVVFNPGQDVAPVTFHAVAAGQATVTLAVPSGFSTPAGALNTMTISVVQASLSCPDLSVGRGLMETGNCTFPSGSAPPGGLTVTLMSADTSKLLFYDATLAGSDCSSGPGPNCAPIGWNSTTTVKFQSNGGGGTISTPFFVQGLVSSGSVQYTASSGTGFNATGTITLTPSSILIAGPFGIGSGFFATAGGSSPITVSTAQLNADNTFAQLQPLATGTSLNVTINSSYNSKGTVTSPVTIAGGTTGSTTQFQALAAGSVTLTVVEPAGFTKPANPYDSVTATITAKSFSVESATVGKNLQTGVAIVLSGTAGPGGVTVTLTSNSPNLKLSTSTTTAGSTSPINVTIPEGQNSTTVYAQALSDVGSGTYTATATGYTSKTGTISFAPSGVILGGIFGQQSQASLAGGPTNSALFLSMVVLDPSTHTVLGTQQLAGGTSLNVGLNNSNNAVGTVPATVTITGGTDTKAVTFTPKAQGITQVSVPAPSGYTTVLPAQFSPDPTVVSVQVN